jgi:outer membrane protein TolC
MHDVDHTALVLRLAEDELLPAAEESARLTALSYRANQVILLDLFHALDELAEVRARVHQARADHALARVRLSPLPQPMQ